jgi:hypothetical protein
VAANSAGGSAIVSSGDPQGEEQTNEIGCLRASNAQCLCCNPTLTYKNVEAHME